MAAVNALGPDATRRRALTLSVAAGLVVGIVAGAVLVAAVNLIAGVGALVVLTAAVAVAIRRGSPGWVLRCVGAVRVGPGDQARLRNMTEGLCATFGLRPPALYVVGDPVPNACAVEGAVVVTSGLLDRLGPIELEGVLAHELAHLKSGDAALASVAALVLWPWARLTGDDRLLHAVVGHGREYRADAVAARTVRYPPGLQAALQSVHGQSPQSMSVSVHGQSPAPSSGSAFASGRLAVTRWLWFDPLVPGSPEGVLDACDVRLEALGEW